MTYSNNRSNVVNDVALQGFYGKQTDDHCGSFEYLDDTMKKELGIDKYHDSSDVEASWAAFARTVNNIK